MTPEQFTAVIHDPVILVCSGVGIGLIMMLLLSLMAEIGEKLAKKITGHKHGEQDELQQMADEAAQATMKMLWEAMRYPQHEPDRDQNTTDRH